VNTLRDLLGVTVPDDAELQPDSVVARYARVGASSAALGEAGVERLEAVTHALVGRVFDDAVRRRALVACDAADGGCARTFLAAFGRRAWRRPLEATELDRYATLARESTTLLGDPWQGLAQATAGLLQSPHFVYRAELGEVDPTTVVSGAAGGPGRRRLTSWELAARLSYLLWATTPDDALLEEAATGRLFEPARLRAQVERLLASPRARQASRTFFRELMGIDSPVLEKDPMVFPKATPGLWTAMREEIERLLEDATSGPEADLRRAFDGRKGFADARLGEIYGLKLATRDRLEPVTHPADGPRVGLLTTAGFLAQHGIPERGSPVLRGLFVREVLLCAHVPEPPDGLDVTLKPNPAARTTRQRLEPHADSPACAGCHSLMDPIGFAFESFDGLGVHRTTENGAPVDTTGALDGQAFQDARSLTALLLAHQDFDRCLVKQVYRYAQGRMESAAEATVVDELTTALRAGKHRWNDLLIALTTSPAFQLAGVNP
jgi:hypothetical protein